MTAAFSGAKRFFVAIGRFGVVATCALSLAGCIETAGVAEYVGSIGGGSGATGPTARPVQLFIASTRSGESGAASQAASPDGTHFSLDIMTIPPGHRAGSIEEPMWGAANSRDHIVVANERQLDADEFQAELASHISGRIGVNRDVLVFVHGYNTSFEEARQRAAQIVADSRFGGVAILFTWPTREGLFGYVSDKDSAMASRDALQALLQQVSTAPGVGKVHVLAHSMGGWLAMEALRQESISGDHDLNGHLGQVMLAAPDIDLTVFAAQMSHIRPAKVTVFANANDRALSLSSAIAQSRPRVGGVDLSNPEDRRKLESLGAKVYDLSKISDGFIDHAAYADAPDVLHAIGAQMATPRAQDVDKMSIIDARGYVDPSAPPAPSDSTAPATSAPVAPSGVAAPAGPAPLISAAPLAPIAASGTAAPLAPASPN